MASLRSSLLAVLSCSATLVLADVNVYDKPMTACGPDHFGGCTYVASDAGAHEVCVTNLPKGFSSNTGQGPWSDEFTGQPWCICIWAYSNYILQNKDLPLKCESIPSKVLEEAYSLDKFKECGSMASTQGCGNEDIRRSIESLCQQCDEQAVDLSSKTALKAKCDSILASAPTVPLSRLYSQGEQALAKKDDIFAAPRIAAAIVLVAVAGLFVGIVRQTSGRFQQTMEVQQDMEVAAAERVADSLFSREAFIE